MQSRIPTPPYTEEEWHKAEADVMTVMARCYPGVEFCPSRWPIANAIIVMLGRIRFEFYLKDVVKGRIVV